MGWWARWPWLVLPTLLAGCQQAALLHPRGPVADANRTILLNSLVIMLAIVIPTMVATVAVAWWFRASNTRARHRPDWEYSGQIELVVWSIPLMVILLLGGVTWIGSHDLDPARPLPSAGKPLRVEVVSLDWKWLFIYPDQQVAAVNQLVLPVGVPVEFSLTSASVMNTFFVPQLGSMIYTMNGMSTRLHLQADQPGTYRGRSAHFSGDGFPAMYFDVKALPQQDFDAWVAGTRSKGEALDTRRYERLAQQGIQERPSTFGKVEPQLYQRIVSQHIAPGPGPALENAGTKGSTPEGDLEDAQRHKKAGH